MDAILEAVCCLLWRRARILSAHGVEDALESSQLSRKTQAWKSCEKLTHRRVKWLRLLAKLFHLEEKYRIKQREHSFLDPCQSGDETWLILGISDDLKDALGVAVRSLLHHFDAGSAIWFMLCLRNQLEASPMRFILNVRLWDNSNSTYTDYL